MKCEDVSMVLQRPGSGTELDRRAAADHLLGCEDCRAAAFATAALRADREALIHVPADQALQRAVASATAHAGRSAHRVPRQPAFWRGVGVGAALAAGIAAAVIMLRPEPTTVAPASAPAVLLALHEQRDVSVALSSPERLVGAEITIALSGEIGLQGFAEQRELRWTTDLDRGVNQLTLPLVALGARGGQVLVQVQHGDKRRAFIVDVRTASDEPTALLPHGMFDRAARESKGI